MEHGAIRVGQQLLLRTPFEGDMPCEVVGLGKSDDFRPVRVKVTLSRPEDGPVFIKVNPSRLSAKFTL